MTDSNGLRQLILSAAGAADVLKILKKAEKPSEVLSKIIKDLTKIVKKYEDSEEQYGHIMDVEGLVGIYKRLKEIEKPSEEVTVAITSLKKLLGIQEGYGAVPAKGTEIPLAPGNLPGYGVGALKASDLPGIYNVRLIKAGDALDGKHWPADVLKANLDKFEGVPLNVITYSGKYGDFEHHLPLDSTFVGSISGNQVGYCKDATWDEREQAVYSKAFITDPARRNLINSMLQEKVDTPGVSIYASGTADEEDRVQGIDEVHSMDLVTFPAAGGQIIERLSTAVKSWGKKLKKARRGKLGGAIEENAPRVAPEEGLPVAETGEGKVYLDEQIGREDLATILQILTEMWGDLPIGGFGSVLLNVLQGLAGRKVTESELKELIMKEVDGYNEYLSMREVPDRTAPKSMVKPKNQESILETPKQEGGFMDETRIRVQAGQLTDLNRRLAELEGRVQVVDSEAMIEDKLAASGLPSQVVTSLKETMSGKKLSPDAVDQFIAHEKKTVQRVAAGLKNTAAVDIEGELIPSKAGGTIEEAMVDLLSTEKNKEEEKE